MDRSSLFFCAATLSASLLLAAAAIPLASVSDATLTKANSVVDSENLGVMDLGTFGKVSVKDLTDYYIENPPVQKTGAVRQVRFEGC